MIARHVGACPRRTVFRTRAKTKKHLPRPPNAAFGGVGRAGEPRVLKTCLVSITAPRGKAPTVARKHGDFAVFESTRLDRFHFE
jgi:hypothetical protein